MNERKPMKPQTALERLASACAKTEYCEEDLRRKMRSWFVDEEYHDEIIDSLRNENYIDDARYCRAYVEDKWRFNQWGKQKIRMNLRMKHLPEEEIDAALQDISDEDYRYVLAQLLKQKRRSLPEAGDYENYQKLIRFAMGRGFEPDAIRECLEQEAEE